jgi:hypothetical protein
MLPIRKNLARPAGQTDVRLTPARLEPRERSGQPCGMTTSRTSRVRTINERAVRKRHFVELAYRAGAIYPCCCCGWEGTSYQLRTLGPGQAIQAAKHEATEHKEGQGNERNHGLASQSRVPKCGS